ncbi:tRNA (adenosine(37)-N6)-threonylcarbamoyltransferase complex transferase subunit TsaD [Prosthecomicrobium hirschii]|uniref:tRNA (adenosine(37)-N6)-threonylcarbamoyltransferase complex transferase subunit TsaD n=1 Tax=Prosthecodimorpha hirschii TaxID=665126 RepID=UPI002220D07A|nr:tRNA (adenosine(37)-N6)-threonylcarbamoyltransferase complex transferase subunit TsaD [Prosthecomicrobium hirschii]MCW1842779.1 tRNA (adenosine(37)-N6)-threonylcarbamoyltransferase complex transferase subunit TsaD [Prosthecomicrobium hirschii]
MLILGIETSCDETAAAVVARDADGRGRILSNVVHSQLEDHAPFGGVVPEIAARAHVEALDGIVARSLAEAGIGFADLDGVAATAGPGLIGGVLVGLMSAKGIALVHGLPLVAVNHLEGHALTARLTDGVEFPYLLLLVSGGHTQFVAVEGLGRYRRLGTTIDDALGEAFDKTAKLLGLAYPGGPAVERAARAGDANRFALPRPLLGRDSLDFSLSGLKTAVRQAAQAAAPLTDRDVADVAAAFQATVAEIVAIKARRALAVFTKQTGVTAPVLVVAGGVAANQAIGASLRAAAAAVGARLVVPPAGLCTDNGAMIAWAGAERLAAGLVDGLDAPARARWPLDADAVPKLGSGQHGAKA